MNQNQIVVVTEKQKADWKKSCESIERTTKKLDSIKSFMSPEQVNYWDRVAEKYWENRFKPDIFTEATELAKKALSKNLIPFKITPMKDIKRDRDWETLAKSISRCESELALWHRQIEFCDLDFSAAFDAWPQDLCLAYRHKEELINRTLRIHFDTNIILIQRDPYGFIPSIGLYP